MFDELKILIAKNAATNGRLFCAMIFAVALVAFMQGHGVWFGRMAVLSAAPVGLSILIDTMVPEGTPGKVLCSAFLSLFTAGLALVLLFSIG